MASSAAERLSKYTVAPSVFVCDVGGTRTSMPIDPDLPCVEVAPPLWRAAAGLAHEEPLGAERLIHNPTVEMLSAILSRFSDRHKSSAWTEAIDDELAHHDGLSALGHRGLTAAHC